VLETVLAFLGGLLIGSFLNVCIFRLPRDLSVVRPRSFCPGCEKTIAWYDNIPLLSYVLLRGRCGHCGESIPVRYPVVELATGAAFAICVATLGPTLYALKYSLFSAILITLIATDLETQILPDEFTLGGTVLGLVLAAFVPLGPGMMQILLQILFSGHVSPRWVSVSEAAFGGAVTSGMIWFIGWLFEKIRHRDGMGLGDVKMIAMIGTFLGLQSTLLTLIIGSLLGSVVGLSYTALKHKNWRTHELPFGSFLGVAALAVAIWYARLG
jgi:leader peptidase (prepilin peptidase)/N-methyltransferase